MAFLNKYIISLSFFFNLLRTRMKTKKVTKKWWWEARRRLNLMVRATAPVDATTRSSNDLTLHCVLVVHRLIHLIVSILDITILFFFFKKRSVLHFMVSVIFELFSSK